MMFERNPMLSSSEVTADYSPELDLDAYSRFTDGMVKNDVANRPFSPSKQVRFRPNITVNSVDLLAGKSSMYDFSEDGVDELTHITSMSFGNPSSPKHFQSTEASPYDTSLWLEGNFDKMCNLSVDTEWSPQNTCQNSSSLRTTDHIPQPPLSSSYSTVTGSRNYSSDVKSWDDQVPRKLPNYLLSRSDDLSLSTLTEVDSFDLDATYSPHSQSVDPGVNLSQPMYKTAETLKKEIKNLSLKINSASETPTDKIRLEAERIVNEACSTLPCGNDLINPLILNPGLTVNIPEHETQFTNLIDLSVDESEIVRLERQRIAAQRKKLEACRKQNAKDKVNEPEPDLLEFFDPNRHVYQSVNIQTKSLPNLLPTLRCAPDDSIQFLHENILCDHYASMLYDV
ncbi:unnamed protein product [Trichobilharzia szidati]|nr:unnamed protein product [Trichobilharzia szidati]